MAEFFDSFDRPSWNTWFMTMAFTIAQRSLDPDTKHGCIVVANDRSVLSVGYNGPPRGSIDANIPLARPQKYLFFGHAEIHAISNAARHGIPLKYSTFYITGHPCEVCFRDIINVGALKVVYGPVGSACVPDETKAVVQHMLTGQDMEFISFPNTEPIQKLLSRTKSYIDGKCGRGEV